MVDYSKVLEKFGKNCFSRNDLMLEIKQIKPDYNEENLKKSLSRLIKSGKLMRVAQGIYTLPESKKHIYSYESMNPTAIEVRERIKRDYPLIDFVMFEMVQLNEFLNHLIAKNTIFIETEKDIEMVLFERLKLDYHPVLFQPKLEDYYLYRQADGIIIKSLPYKYPKSRLDKHGTSIEKLIVDLFANELIRNSISGGDYPEALRDIFTKYQINETKLFRYAIYRGVANELEAMLKREDIKLYTR